jgi:hypothetical protein
MYEYTQEFNNLAQYGGHHVDTDAKKVELYRKGLNIPVAGPPDSESEFVIQ